MTDLSEQKWRATGETSIITNRTAKGNYRQLCGNPSASTWHKGEGQLAPHEFQFPRRGKLPLLLYIATETPAPG